MELDKYALLCHKDCMDGSACAIAFVIFGGKRENVFFTSPNHKTSDRVFDHILDKGFKNIIVADCSISPEKAKEVDAIKHTFEDIVLLDHHKTALPLTEFSWCTIDKENSMCGSMMLFTYLSKKFNKDINSAFAVARKHDLYGNFFKLVDDIDRWIKLYKESDDLALLHSTLGQRLFIDRFLKNPSTELTNEEKYVFNLESEKLQEMIADKKKQVQSSIFNIKINNKYYRFGFIGGAPKYTSALSQALYEDPLLDLDVVVCVGADTCSFRARKNTDIDVAELAKKYGGGGHQKASGLSLADLFGKSIIEQVVDKLRG